MITETQSYTIVTFGSARRCDENGDVWILNDDGSIRELSSSKGDENAPYTDNMLRKDVEAMAGE